MNLKEHIITIPNFPKQGIMFRDITPVIEDKDAYQYACDQIASFAKSKGAEKIAGPEARGFIFGCPVAKDLHIGFSPIRKPHKLPRKTVSVEYQLEYGVNTLCMHEDSIKKGDKVVIVDDLLATGGTVKAACELVEKLGGIVVGVAFVIELVDLKGREVLKDYDVFSIVTYEGE